MDQVLQEFINLPPFTRIWIATTIAITAAYTFDTIKINDLILDWDLIFTTNDQKKSQYYRIITCFCTCEGGKLNQFPTLFLLYTMYMHSKGYELNPFRANSGSRFVDTVFAVIVCVILLLLTHVIINTYVPSKHTLYPILTRNLVSCFIYLWSKKNPTANIQLNFIPIKGAYLPLAHIVLSLLLKNRIHEMLHGFVIGHLYYFLIDVVPTVLGYRVLWCPRVVTQLLCNEHELEYQIESFHIRPAQNTMQYYTQIDGATNTHVYAKTGNLEALRALSNNDNSRSLFMATDRNGWQPIHEAIRGKHLNVVQFLIIDQQVDIFATTRSGDTVISLSRQFCGDDHPITELILQVMEEQR